MDTNGTPSPQIKETGSNKTVMIEQSGPSTSRSQPEAQSPQGPSLEVHGQDGISATNTATPNNNPNPDPDIRKQFQLPPQISYKHSPNLLVKAKLQHQVNTDIPIYPAPTISLTTFPAKNIKYRNEQCGTCNQLGKSHYSSYQTKQYFSIPQIFSCDTTNPSIL